MPDILAVDDSPTMRAMVAETLRSAGFNVITAPDGLAAVDIARHSEVHLVLTDVNMPGMDGIALVRALRLLPAYQSTPVLVLTTERDDVKQQVREAGANGWIPKPFDPDRLIEIVKKFIG